MCGIAGVFTFDADVPVQHADLDAMARVLCHRGPDDSGFLIDRGIGLAFRRLSIIDLSTGNQPHCNEDQSVFSICNGEIFNYRELRSHLTGKGHAFRSHCDVEVIVHLYEEYGTDLFKHLNGQFALAVYDKKNRRLLLGRDHVGIAPLFYTKVDNALLFASEIKALLDYPGVRREVNLTGLDQILTFPGPISPVTMFKGIHSVQPGHYLSVRETVVETHEYWDLIYPEIGDQDATVSESKYVEQLEDRLARSVRYRLNADVPVGFYLSGGLDSSLVASLIHSVSPDVRRHSFSITFPQSEIDERRYQKMMAEFVGSIHHEIEFHRADILDRLQDVIRYTECPLKESYDTCSLALSGLVKQSGLKVILTGEGADELFAGYVGYRFDETRRDLEDFLDAETMLENELREMLWGDPDFFYEKNYNEFRETKTALYSDELVNSLPEFDCLSSPVVDTSKIQNRHAMHKRSYIDFKIRLADHLLSDHGDRVAYANSVEARYPFLDVDLIDMAKTIPPKVVLKNDTEKYILRKVSEKYLPAAVRDREKFGFVAPGSPYLLRQNVDWVNDILSTETIRRQGYFNPATVERLKTMYSQEGATVNTTFETDFLMIVLTFGIFLDTFDMPART